MRFRKTCKVCGEAKKVPTRMQKGVDRKDFLRDEYCSRKCCEADHGLGDKAEDRKTGQKPPPNWSHGTWYGYAKMGCRCDECRAYVSEKRKARREREKDLKTGRKEAA